MSADGIEGVNNYCAESLILVCDMLFNAPNVSMSQSIPVLLISDEFLVIPRNEFERTRCIRLIKVSQRRKGSDRISAVFGRRIIIAKHMQSRNEWEDVGVSNIWCASGRHRIAERRPIFCRGYFLTSLHALPMTVARMFTLLKIPS